MLSLLKKAKGEIEEKPQVKITTKVVVTEGESDESKYDENVVDQFDIEDIEHEEVQDAPSEVLVDNINKNMIAKESKELDDELESQKKISDKEKFEANKKKLLERYKKK